VPSILSWVPDFTSIDGSYGIGQQLKPKIAQAIWGVTRNLQRGPFSSFSRLEKSHHVIDLPGRQIVFLSRHIIAAVAKPDDQVGAAELVANLLVILRYVAAFSLWNPKIHESRRPQGERPGLIGQLGQCCMENVTKDY
jgi:hypothetical protein